MSGARQRPLGAGGQHVLDYLRRMQAENPAFYYAVQGDSEQSGGSLFWADGAARTNYSYFGDTVVFDTTYRTGHYKVPFASLTGLNHHGQPVLFGCALMLNESESSFVWLLQTWLHAMSGVNPVSITTDPDGLIQAAVAQVLPRTRHRFSKFGIFRETKEKLSHIYQSHPTFELEFKKCINENETTFEFESSWAELLERYYLTDNNWLLSIYNARQQWVPVYLRDTFFGDLSSPENQDCLDAYFDDYINAATSIQVLLKQYEKAVSSWHEKELKADYDTTSITPTLKTPSPMEKQAAGLYTRRIFMKFQDELVETLANPATRIEDSGTVSVYRVFKFGEDHKAHTVTFNSLETKASCSCQMFEYLGIICRHILAVFRPQNVLTLPSQYILRRWTQDAKCGAVVEPLPAATIDFRDSMSVRYNNLRHEAIKYVEEGAKSIHIYNVAMEALREAAKKVVAVRCNGPEATSQGTIANGDSRQFHSTGGGQIGPSQSVGEKEKRIRELSAELESTNQRCEVYRANLLAILRDMEDQKLKLSVKVQSARLSLNE